MSITADIKLEIEKLLDRQNKLTYEVEQLTARLEAQNIVLDILVADAVSKIVCEGLDKEKNGHRKMLLHIKQEKIEEAGN